MTRGDAQLITDLVRENERLKLGLATAESQLRLVRSTRDAAIALNDDLAAAAQGVVAWYDANFAMVGSGPEPLVELRRLVSR